MAWKAEITVGGSLLMKPTVSVIRISSPWGRRMRRVTGSRVAKRRSAEGTPAWDRVLKRVLLPALV